MSFEDQREQMKSGQGFVAALDQSGGSTPKALALYGVNSDSYSGDDEMFTEIHRMRSRIILSEAFTSQRVIGAILFDRTVRDTIEGRPVAEYLWQVCGVVPFLKVDKGLQETADGVQMMKPIDGLEKTLAWAREMGIFGTKMRSVIQAAKAEGVAANVAQQFAVAAEIAAAGLVPIIEPEVNIHSDSKAEAEAMVKTEIARQLDALPDDTEVMLKLTLPSRAGFYDDLASHPRLLRIVALSGGYSTDVACRLLAQNDRMIASFSRALTEGLQKQMSEAEFDAALGSNIEKIYQASI